ncbi:3-alpha-hydroxycholanate dehydrogenase (NADP(+)) [Rhodococcus fascians]|uniref:SDR family NAD(P)-dependent oxidoreductase n=1 Tax=Nocardiaceae TaxID=85025 RepID=UPI001427D1F6|nr:SDR family oxidoreductase [Rhodococcus sp. 06-221-2]NIL85890.1 3-alpha-hydroxycholanate dehydrogenase (NADP(+)) [Rhodococcus fascians]NIL91501.1 3-alpha-hydroxycholanate dehydrogenase (NADP(+)) [Rhodococcus fascians]
MDLQGRVAVVTGGASGIGAASVELLRESGAVPVSWDLGGSPDIKVDVSDATAVGAAIAETVERFGRPTLLVAAAAVPHRSLIIDHDVEAWDRVFAVGMRGVMLSIQAVARTAIEEGTGGSFVLISSNNGILADRYLSAYSSVKAGVNHLARVAARELGEHDIRVNAIGPGPTETQMLAKNLQIPGYVEKIEQVTPLGRIGTSHDIADSIVNLMRAGWITGQVVQSDGGASLTTPRGDSRSAGQATANGSNGSVPQPLA